jgi:hypothetical protein
MLAMDSILGGSAVILASMLLSVIGLLLVRYLISVDWLKQHRELAGYYFLMIGTLYAVLIAFAIYAVWSQFESAGANLEHEATEVADLSRLAMAMPSETRLAINGALLEYLNAVTEDEFPAMAEDRISERTWAAVQRLWEAYANAQPDTPKLQGYFNESLKHLTSLSDLRRTRLLASRGTVPTVLWALLGVGGAMLVSFTYFVGHESVWSQALMTACLTGILSFSMVLIVSLDSPYTGAARVTPVAFRLEKLHVAARVGK